MPQQCNIDSASLFDALAFSAPSLAAKPRPYLLARAGAFFLHGVASPDDYVERLIGCMECDRWGWKGSALFIELPEEI
jgi:hypothetical protein